MNQDDRLRILICIGGGPEAYTGIKFAARFGKDTCADIVLLYVRPLDSGLQSGGMEVRVARENMLDWGLELPGMRHLGKARDILINLGEISEQADNKWLHRELSGEPVGEYFIEYDNPCGGTISLRLRTASDVVSAVVDEAERFDADMIIVGGSPVPKGGWRKLLSKKHMALKVASHSEHSVVVARQLEPGNGHLVCVDNSERSREMVAKVVRHAHACQCPISILSVAENEDMRDQAQSAVDTAVEILRSGGVEPHEALVEIGDPVDVITTIGYDFSLVVLAESAKPWFAKGFSVSHEVAEQARNSVMIVK